MRACDSGWDIVVGEVTAASGEADGLEAAKRAAVACVLRTVRAKRQQQRLPLPEGDDPVVWRVHLNTKVLQARINGFNMRVWPGSRPDRYWYGVRGRGTCNDEVVSSVATAKEEAEKWARSHDLAGEREAGDLPLPEGADEQQIAAIRRALSTASDASSSKVTWHRVSAPHHDGLQDEQYEATINGRRMRLMRSSSSSMVWWHPSNGQSNVAWTLEQAKREAYEWAIKQRAPESALPLPESLADLLAEERTTQSKTCVMAYVSDADATVFHTFQDGIDPDDVYWEGDEYGVEEDAHVTALYGILPDVPERDIVEKLGGVKPVKITLGAVSTFPDDPDKPYAVLKVDVESPDLERLNATLRELPYENDYDEYHAHLTLAYVKKEAASKYCGEAPFTGQQLTS
jgi:hypothetical protein